MDTYQKLYYKLFNAISDALDELTHAQLDCESQFMSSTEQEKASTNDVRSDCK